MWYLRNRYLIVRRIRRINFTTLVLFINSTITQHSGHRTTNWSLLPRALIFGLLLVIRNILIQESILRACGRIIPLLPPHHNFLHRGHSFTSALTIVYNQEETINYINRRPGTIRNHHHLKNKNNKKNRRGLYKFNWICVSKLPNHRVVPSRWIFPTPLRNWYIVLVEKTES